VLFAVLTVTSFQTVFPSGTAYGHIEETPTEMASSVVQTNSPLFDTELVVRSYFQDIPVMIQIARCESGFRHTLADGSVLRGIVDKDDTGVMQINRRYHEKQAVAMGLDLNDLYQNMTYARALYNKEGTRPWSASAFCWNKNQVVLKSN